MIGPKWCPGCEAWLDVDHWQKNKSTKDGLQTRCATCQTASVQKSRAKRAKAVAWADRRLRDRYADEHRELVQLFMDGVRR